METVERQEEEKIYANTIYNELTEYVSFEQAVFATVSLDSTVFSGKEIRENSLHPPFYLRIDLDELHANSSIFNIYF